MGLSHCDKIHVEEVRHQKNGTHAGWDTLAGTCATRLVTKIGLETACNLFEIGRGKFPWVDMGVYHLQVIAARNESEAQE